MNPAESGGLCPKCLMAMNMASQTDVTGDSVGEQKTKKASRAPKPPPTPSTIAKHFPQFEIIELLGRGGMGVVYKARQKSLDRLVALKILAPEREKDDQFAERFSREAKILAKLNQENIVTIHDFGATGGMYYLVMELVDGFNLRQLLDKGVMTPEKALTVVPAVCEALEYAHQQGVVHRDIKPENVLLDKQGRVKIADFGIAKILGRNEQAQGPQSADSVEAGDLTKGERLGTPSYMAPEQVEKPTLVDHRADIYSLGIVFYEMLTGELPGARLQPPSKKVQVDVQIDEAVIRALEKEPERRYQTAAQFKTALDAANLNDPSYSPGFDWRTWTPGQSAKTREICAHMTESERNASALRGVKIGLALCVLNIPVIIGVDTLFPGGFYWLVPITIVPAQVFLLCFMLSNNERIFLCSTAWAKKQVITPEQLKSDHRTHSWFAWIGMFKRSWKRWVGLASAIALSVVLLAGWLQRVRPIGGMISAESPGGMFSADGQTLHQMRIFGGDKTFYRFRIQGYGGSFWVRWLIPIPTKILAPDYLVMSLQSLMLDSHGAVIWSEDGKRVSFQVNGVEVDAFNTEDRSHSFQDGYLPEKEVELRANAMLQNVFLDLDTGRVLSAPSELVSALASQGVSGRIPQIHHLQEWMSQSGADLVCRSDLAGLRGVHGVTMLVEKHGRSGDPRAFDTTPASRVVDGVEAVENVLKEFPQHSNNPYALFTVDTNDISMVKTREGGMALVEILTYDSSSGVTRLRYKLVEQEN